jgi:ligand-binding sensor domain-containing protein/two-component sensor histidine kinase
VFFLALGSLHAQPLEMRFDRISLEQGLSDLTVFCMAQDSIGFLWFGTGDGLNKYDGHTFTVFRPDPADTTSLESAIINSLCVDRAGVLWIATGTGLCTLHPDSTVPRKFTHRSGQALPRSTTWLETLRDGSIGIGAWEGFYIYKQSSDEFTRVDFDTLEPVVVTTFTEGKDGTLWIATSGRGLIAYNPTTRTRVVFTQDKRDPRILFDNVVNRVIEDADGRIWVATNSGLCKLNENRTALMRYTEKAGLADDIIFDLLQDRRGRLWVGTFHLGLALYRPETDSFVQHVTDPEDLQSINSNRLTRMFEDRGGVLWCGTYRAGLNRLNAKRSSFKRYTPRRTPGAGLMSDGVYAIMEDSHGTVWIGSYGGGLNQYEPQTGKYSYHRPNRSSQYAISGENPLSLLESSTGELWVGSYGLDRFDRATKRFIHYPLKNERKRVGSDREVKCMTEVSDGSLWLGTFGGGVHRLNPKTGQIHTFEYPDSGKDSPRMFGIWAICEDARGRLWLGSYGNGLFVLDKETGAYRHLPFDLKNPSRSPSAVGIYDIHRTKDGILWVGTMGGGLDRVNPETMEFRHYTTRQGLPNNYIKGIEEDSHGFLWLSTDFGISRFDPRTEAVMNLKEEDGLMGNVFLSGAHSISKSGRLYFGGEKGAVSFHPDSIAWNRFVAPIVITTVRVLDRPYPLWQPREFPHTQNSLAFEFVALDYTNPNMNSYAYKMEGADARWIEAGKRRYASYPHLVPGTYTFIVKGSNNDGLWNEQGATYRFTITPPFWNTPWFIGSVAAVLLAIGVVAYNYRVNRLLEIERLRVRIASDLHDDIGSSLTRISLQSELIQENIEPEEQQNYLKSIAAMSRELVTSMSDIVWSIDARNDSIGSILDKMRNFGTTTLSMKDVSFSLAHSGLDQQKKISVAVRENLYLVFKEAINNIAKHASATNVQVVLRNDSDKFTMIIADDGKGWEGNERPSGHGIKNMKMRAARLGGTLEFVRDEGTRVVLTMKRI